MKKIKEQPIPFSNLSKIALAIGLTASTYGAGFQLAERSTIGLGRAYSGEAAIGDDASVLASNPAGMTLLEGTQVTAGIQVILPQVEVEATNLAGRSGSTDEVAPFAAVPNVYVTHKLNDKVSIGLGTFTTYGLKTDYPSSFTGVIGSDYSEIFSVNMQPSVAYKVNDRLSLGAGLNIMYVKGEITSDPLQTATGVPLSNSFELKGDDLVFGYNVGMLYEFSESTRIGLHYRSAMDLNIEGDAEFGGRAAAFNGDASLAVELPDILEFSAYHEINDQWAIHGDAVYTFWSKFKELAPQVNPAVNDALVTPENWNDVIRLSVGATYKYDEQLTLRAGFAWDQSPVDDEYRTYRIPDTERYWLSAGASYAVNSQLTVDAGYTYIFAEPTTISAIPGVNEELADGKASGDVQIFGLGATYKF